MALVVLSGPDIAVTAYGSARQIDGPFPPGVVPVRVRVEQLQDHFRPTFAIEQGVRWRWDDAEAEARDAEVRAALSAIAERGEHDG